MKQIYPTATVEQKNQNETTQMLDSLIERVNQAEKASAEAVECFESYKCDKSTTASFNNITANNVSGEVIQGSTTNTQNLTSRKASIDNITSSSIQASSVVSGERLQSRGSLEVEGTTTLSSTRVNGCLVVNGTTDYCCHNIKNVGCLCSGYIIADDVDIRNADIDNINSRGCINTTTFVSDTVQGREGLFDSLSATNLDIKKLQGLTTISSSCINVEHSTHCNVCQNIDTSFNDHYVLLPIYRNGTYRLYATNDGGEYLWDIIIEVNNDEPKFRFSQTPLSNGALQRLVELKYKKTNGQPFVQVYFKNQENNRIYYQSDSYDNTKPPLITTTDNLTDYDKLYSLSGHKSGNFIGDFAVGSTLRIQSLEMDGVDVENVTARCNLFIGNNLALSCNPNINPDGSINWNWNCGSNDQYLIKRNGMLAYESSSPNLGGGNAEATDKSLVTVQGLLTWDGEGYDDCYPIRWLGRDACARGDLHVWCQMDSDGLCSNKVLFYNDAFSINCDVPPGYSYLRYCCNWFVRNRSGTEGYVIPYCTNTNGSGIVYYDCKCKIFCSNPSLNAEDGCFTGDVYIAKDLYVCGKTHTVESETISTGADNVILRQNNNTSLACGEASGFLVNKYNGTDTLAVVVDNCGWLQVGDVKGTNTTYASICYCKDGLWYSNNAVVSPQGELTSYSCKSIYNNYTVYTNAVFTCFNYSCLQTVATRADNIRGGALLTYCNCRITDACIPTYYGIVGLPNGKIGYEKRNISVLCNDLAQGKSALASNCASRGSLIWVDCEKPSFMTEDIA